MHNWHNNWHKILCKYHANHANIMQNLCRNYAEIMHIMHIINISFIIGIININIQFMLGDPGWFPEPTQVSTA